MNEKSKNSPRIFLSHAGADNKRIARKEGTGLIESLTRLLKEYCTENVFCSSVSGNGIKAGEYLHDTINEEIRECTIFLAIITDNYIRSPHCLYELSAARFSIRKEEEEKKKVVVIYSNEQVQDNIKHIADPEWRSIDLKGNVSDQNAVELLNALGLNSDIKLDRLVKILRRIVASKAAKRPFVGMSESVYNNLLRYCEQESIIKFGTGAVYTQKEMVERCKNAKTIYLISTTGAGLLKTLKEDALKGALQNDAQINIIIPDLDSPFITDVAEAECCRPGYNLVIKEQNKRRIKAEFEATVQYLNETYCLAKRGKKSEDFKGKITLYSSRTLLRQTLFLTVSEEESTWGWVNMTMAPLRTSETPTIAISDLNAKKGLDKYIIEHCKSLIKMAENHNACREINGKTDANSLETKEMSNHEKYWIKKRKTAIRFMKKRTISDKILVEVAAQHPLIDGELPNEEFQKRLDTAIQIYNENNGDNIWFYVPGSRHKYNDIEDKISLSEAGKNYLVKYGIDKSHIYAEESNDKYKGENGVYNSADESYVASCIFKDDNFGRMICVCSPYQIMRKSFYYIEFGIIPKCIGVACNEMYHDPISEYFGSLRHTVIEDHNWQDEDSKAAQESRKERKV